MVFGTRVLKWAVYGSFGLDIINARSKGPSAAVLRTLGFAVALRDLDPQQKLQVQLLIRILGYRN